MSCNDCGPGGCCVDCCDGRCEWMTRGGLPARHSNSGIGGTMIYHLDSHWAPVATIGVLAPPSYSNVPVPIPTE